LNLKQEQGKKEKKKGDQEKEIFIKLAGEGTTGKRKKDEVGNNASMMK